MEDSTSSKSEDEKMVLINQSLNKEIDLDGLLIIAYGEDRFEMSGSMLIRVLADHSKGITQAAAGILS